LFTVEALPLDGVFCAWRIAPPNEAREFAVLPDTVPRAEARRVVIVAEFDENRNGGCKKEKRRYANCGKFDFAAPVPKQRTHAFDTACAGL